MTFVDKPRFGSICSGIGGMDLGFTNAGFESAWQIEIGKTQQKVLRRHFPGVPLYNDLTKFTDYDLAPVQLICGGDPCPKHSHARSNGDSVHPDLSGYFLALVGRLRPEWVVRENVPAPTVSDFDACLAALGYGTVVIRMDAASVTGQSRQRDYVVGQYQASRQSLRQLFSECSDGPGTYTTRLGTRPIIPALTAHRTRYDSRDCYVWEEGTGLRILDGDERDAFAGFKPGWTAGLSEAARATTCGNSAVPALSEYLGRIILGQMETRVR